MSMKKCASARSLLAAVLLAGIGMASMPAHAAPRFQPHEQMLMTDSLLPGGRVSVSQFRDSGSVEDAMRERSRFTRRAGRWLYLDAVG